MDILSYRVIRSSRRTLALEITRDGHLLVRSPYGLPDSQIDRFVKSKEGWIRKHQARKIPGEAVSAEALQALTRQAALVLPGRVEHYAALLGVSYGRITVRHQKTRWGSCSAKGNLNFNCLLMLAPSQVVDYVVVHELCHRIHMNHSPQFWAQVESLCPGYKQQRSWLRENGAALVAKLG